MSRSRTRLVHSITLERPDPAPDTFGEPIPAWVEVKTVDALVRPATAREAEVAKGLRGLITHKVALHYDPDLAAIDPTWRVVFGSRVLNLVGVYDPDERGRDLMLDAVEVAAGA